MEEQHKRPSSRHPASKKPESANGNTPGSSGKFPVEDTQFTPQPTLEEYEALSKALEKAQQEGLNNLEGWQRERAEFSNYKRRIERDQVQLTQAVTGSVIKKYLVILDDLDLALKNRPTDKDSAAWVGGIELVVRKLEAIIESEGVERINQNKVPFDPNLHEAISHEENPDFECDEVIEVVRQGYKLGDRILRPAMVRVAR
jgi:molecular chaperone GrpE